jgi:hypothetical protein
VSYIFVSSTSHDVPVQCFRVDDHLHQNVVSFAWRLRKRRPRDPRYQSVIFDAYCSKLKLSLHRYVAVLNGCDIYGRDVHHLDSNVYDCRFSNLVPLLPKAHYFVHRGLSFFDAHVAALHEIVKLRLSDHSSLISCLDAYRKYSSISGPYFCDFLGGAFFAEAFARFVLYC